MVRFARVLDGVDISSWLGSLSLLSDDDENDEIDDDDDEFDFSESDVSFVGSAATNRRSLMVTWFEPGFMRGLRFFGDGTVFAAAVSKKKKLVKIRTFEINNKKLHLTSPPAQKEMEKQQM